LGFSHCSDKDRGCGVPAPSELPDYSAGLKQGVKGFKIGILQEGFDFNIMDLGPPIHGLAEFMDYYYII
jgi:hypothetical protein